MSFDCTIIVVDFYEEYIVGWPDMISRRFWLQPMTVRAGRHFLVGQVPTHSSEKIRWTIAVATSEWYIVFNWMAFM